VSSDGKLIVCVSDMDNEMDISLATNGECLHKVKGRSLSEFKMHGKTLSIGLDY
jgi:hypothetical protein